jgi:hypothetical protein
MPQDHKHRQQPKVDRRHHEEIHGAKASGMVAQERLPSLARSWPTLGHVLGNRRLRDLDPQLQQFAMNAWCAPQGVLLTHPPD